MRIRHHCFVDSPLGTLTLVNTDGVLSGLYMEAQAEGRHVLSLGVRTDGGFDAIADQLRDYFAGQRTEFTVPLAASGTPFQQAVWAALRTIPYGETRTYAEVAEAIGNRAAVRAVGLANGRNPISIVVPCHRVIGSNGSLTGYGGGLGRKRFLLDLEHASRPLQTALF
jgi:methylated-DNA-[protein]-cysteine S-methyltransferase